MGDVETLLEREAEHHARLQMPTAQLTYIVASALGAKDTKPADWLTGFARRPEEQVRLHPDLELGLQLGVVSQAAFDSLSS